MFKIAIIIPLYLLIFQPCLSMENDKIQEPSTLKGFDQKQLKLTDTAYKARAYEMDNKAAMLLIQTSELGAKADSLTDEANSLASIARNSSGTIEDIEEAYKSAEQTYRNAVKAHIDARNTELTAAKIELAAAKAEKALYELLVTPNTEIISDGDFSENEHVIKARLHMTHWRESKNNAKAAKSLILMLLYDLDMLRSERKKRVQSLQEATRGQSHILPTDLDSPS